jgi:hypothetical protein
MGFPRLSVESPLLSRDVAILTKLAEISGPIESNSAVQTYKTKMNRKRRSRSRSPDSRNISKSTPPAPTLSPQPPPFLHLSPNPISRSDPQRKSVKMKLSFSWIIRIIQIVFGIISTSAYPRKNYLDRLLMGSSWSCCGGDDSCF